MAGSNSPITTIPIRLEVDKKLLSKDILTALKDIQAEVNSDAIRIKFEGDEKQILSQIKELSKIHPELVAGFKIEGGTKAFQKQIELINKEIQETQARLANNKATAGLIDNKDLAQTETRLRNLAQEALSGKGNIEEIVKEISALLSHLKELGGSIDKLNTTSKIKDELRKIPEGMASSFTEAREAIKIDEIELENLKDKLNGLISIIVEAVKTTQSNGSISSEMKEVGTEVEKTGESAKKVKQDLSEVKQELNGIAVTEDQVKRITTAFENLEKAITAIQTVLSNNNQLNGTLDKLSEAITSVKNITSTSTFNGEQFKKIIDPLNNLETHLKTISNLMQNTFNGSNIAQGAEQVATQVDKVTESYDRLENVLEKTYETSGKKDATAQLRETHKQYSASLNEKGYLPWDIDQLKVTYEYIRAIQEALNKGINKNILERYTADIHDWQYRPDFNGIEPDPEIMEEELNRIIPVLKDYYELITLIDSKGINLNQVNNLLPELEEIDQHLYNIPEQLNDIIQTKNRLREARSGQNEFWTEEDASVLEKSLQSEEEMLKLSIEWWQKYSEERNKVIATSSKDPLISEQAVAKTDEAVQELNQDAEKVVEDVNKINSAINSTKIDSSSGIGITPTQIDNLITALERLQTVIETLSVKVSEFDFFKMGKKLSASQVEQVTVALQNTGKAFEDDTAKAKELETVTEELEQAVKEVSSASTALVPAGFYDNAREQLMSYNEELERRKALQDEMTSVLERYREEQEREAQAVKEAEEAEKQRAKEYKIISKDIEDISKKIQSLYSSGKSEFAQTPINSLIEMFSRFVQAVRNSEVTFDDAKAHITNFGQALESINTIIKETGKGSAQASTKAIDFLLNRMQKFIDLNPHLSSGRKNRVVDLMNEVNTQANNLSNDGLANVERRFNAITIEGAKFGELGKGWFEGWQKRLASLTQYLTTFVSFYRIVGYAREAFTTIKDLDYALVDLRKTTTMTEEELNSFYRTATDVGAQMGTTTEEIISQAAAWSRLGYSTNEAATQMAALSSKFAAISPGMSLDTATDGLVSTMKAFHIDVEDAEREIMDSINRIGNTMATSNEEVVEMLTRSSAAMYEANNDLAQTIALESAAVQITRNAETTGTAFRTISMRIRGKHLCLHMLKNICYAAYNKIA